MVPVVDVLNGASGCIHSSGGGSSPSPTFHFTSFRKTTHGDYRGPHQSLRDRFPSLLGPPSY